MNKNVEMESTTFYHAMMEIMMITMDVQVLVKRNQDGYVLILIIKQDQFVN